MYYDYIGTYDVLQNYELQHWLQM